MGPRSGRGDAIPDEVMQGILAAKAEAGGIMRLANLAGLVDSYIYNILSGRTKTMKPEGIERLRLALRGEQQEPSEALKHRRKQKRQARKGTTVAVRRPRTPKAEVHVHASNGNGNGNSAQPRTDPVAARLLGLIDGMAIQGQVLRQAVHDVLDPYLTGKH